MKWFIASDIHGSAKYCREMLDAAHRENADRILLLGDILYHGPRNDLPEEYDPKAVISMLNPLKDNILCVRGNCDSEVDQMVLNFPIMAEYAILCEGAKMVYATHGHNINCDRLPPLHKGDILLHGHTHIPDCKEMPSFTYINPGSVSIPKENSEHSYIILENGAFIWKNLEGKEYMRYIIGDKE